MFKKIYSFCLIGLLFSIGLIASSNGETSPNDENKENIQPVVINHQRLNESRETARLELIQRIRSLLPLFRNMSLDEVRAVHTEVISSLNSFDPLNINENLGSRRNRGQ